LARRAEKMLREYFSLRVLITLVALALAVTHLFRPELTVDSITLVLGLVAVLPWLQPVVKSFEMLGVKFELQELRAQVADARGAAANASNLATFAKVGSSARSAQPTDSSPGEMEHLADEYEKIRATQKSGPQRTEAMTRVVRQMIDLSPRQPDFNVGSALASPRPGLRLAAYSYLYEMKDTNFLRDLVESVTQREDKPFGQYWGLQAISSLLENVQPQELPRDIVESLARFSARVPPGTDRDYVVRNILKVIQAHRAE